MDLDEHDPHVPLEGAYNFRDLGGYPTADGGRVRTGQVYRADGLGGLTDGDLERLRELGLRTVVDFRRSDERDEAPTVVWDHDMELLHLGVDAAGDERQDLMGQLLAGDLGVDPIGEMAQLYADILEDFADRFATLFDHLAREERRPAVFHCTAGKDRTGIAAMLVLHTAGVSWDTIVHDYCLTHRYRTVHRIPVLEPSLGEAGLTVDHVLPFIGAVPEVMERTLVHVERTYGGIDRYLRERAGVPQRTVSALREALVEYDVTHLSFVDQLLHYFDRPHVGVPEAPVGGRGAWRGEELAGSDEWVVHLTEQQVDEVRAATTAVLSTGRPMEELDADDFPIPSLEADIAAWRSELDDGRGFVLVRGLPVHEWDRNAVETAYWCLGHHLGQPGAQNGDGDLLGHVLDLGEDANHPASRLYRTSHDIRFHCDAADAVGLLCLRTAEEGGASRLVSSVAVFDQLAAERPDLVPRLFEPFKLDSRLEPGREPRFTPVQPCCFDGARLRTFMHTEYFGSVDRHEGVTLDELEHDVLSTWEEIAERPGMHLDMQLEPGDLQLVSNHTVVHARTGYRDAADPGQRRHLLRLWLSLARG